MRVGIFRVTFSVIECILFLIVDGAAFEPLLKVIPLAVLPSTLCYANVTLRYMPMCLGSFTWRMCVSVCTCVCVHVAMPSSVTHVRFSLPISLHVVCNAFCILLIRLCSHEPSHPQSH